MTIELDAVIQQAYQLAPLPASAARMATLVADHETEVDEIVQVVSFDPALTANLLRAANSASFGARVEVTSVRDAFVRIGAGNALALAVGTSVRGNMTGAAPSFDLEEGDLWRHSIAAALAANLLRSAAEPEIPAEVFTAALLHDLGKLVLSRFIDFDHREWLRQAREGGGQSGLGAEQEVLEVNHGELGGLIAHHWGLPDSIAWPIQYHHEPEQAPGEEPDLGCYAVNLANLLAEALGQEDVTGFLEKEDQAGAMELLGVTAERCSELVARLDERLDEVVSWYQ